MEQILIAPCNIANELIGVKLEPRLVRRAMKMIEEIEKEPAKSYPDIFDNESELEAAYRFYGNPNVSFETLLSPHVEQTLNRCRRNQEILILEDTTEFVFGGEARRKGLHRVNTNDQGFLGHFALAVSNNNGQKIPLGVLGAELYTRPEEKKKGKKDQHKRRQEQDCESLRWGRMVDQVELMIRDDEFSAIQVMDREGDIYDLLADCVTQPNRRFIIRASKNRTILSEDPEYRLLFDALDGLAVRYCDVIQVSARGEKRPPGRKKTHPSRRGRKANIGITATPVTIQRTRNSLASYPKTITLNLVHAFEIGIPEGEDAIEWILLTNEPIETIEHLNKVVDSYRTRWIIEELFKAIKTGCIFEKRQLETYHSLKNALAIILPIAWEMVLLRSQAHQLNSSPAEAFINPLRIEVLRELSVRCPLKDNPTIYDVFMSIAGLGGHLKHNGLPGWITLRRGYEQLLFAEKVWFLSRKRCDQS